MKISDIKTKDQFYKFANVWYQRVHKLRIIWQDSKEDEKRRIKAFLLWDIMKNRVMKLVPIAIKLNQIKPRNE